jgi:hypothetical protein
MQARFVDDRGISTAFHAGAGRGFSRNKVVRRSLYPVRCWAGNEKNDCAAEPGTRHTVLPCAGSARRAQSTSLLKLTAWRT